jgi:predicted DCC family thiol-disulfide oxidoreductase YuxK
MKTIIFYDGLCALCNQSVAILKRLDWLHRLEYADLQAWESVHALYPQLDREAALDAMHVFRPDGELYAGYAAIRQISRELPLFCWVYPLLYLPGVTSAGPRLYRWISTHRYELNRLFGGPTECENGACSLHKR